MNIFLLSETQKLIEFLPSSLNEPELSQSPIICWFPSCRAQFSGTPYHLPLPVRLGLRPSPSLEPAQITSELNTLFKLCTLDDWDDISAKALDQTPCFL